MTAAFPSVVEALAHWRDRDRAPLRAAVVPPCDALRDEIFDCFLAVTFKRIAELPTVTEQSAILQAGIACQRATIAALNDARREPQPGHVRRLDAVIAVLARWQDQILDEAAQRHAEGRAA